MADWDEPDQGPAPWRSRPATLSPGPAPTGRDKIFDSVYGWLGGKPENRWAADKLTDVATLGGMAPWTAVYDGGRELAETGRPAALATALIPGARVAAPVAKAAEKAVERGIRAFHGSPHDFDRFDLSKIGTGEGHQAFGRGLYFAENPSVAESYKYVHGGIPAAQSVSYMGNEISDLAGIGKATLRPAGAANPLDTDGLLKFPPVETGSSMHNFGVGATPAKLKDILPDYTDHQIAALQALISVKGDGGKASEILMAKGKKEAAKIAEETASQFKINQISNPGHMYEVNIKADPDDFLDWDKPLSQQSEKVRQALPFIQEKAIEARRAAKGNVSADDEAYLRSHDLPISDLVRVLKEPSAFREAGIPGIRYLDQGSRGAGEGSRNLVVFDDSLIDIVRKYGIAGLLAAYYGGSPSQADAKTPQD